LENEYTTVDESTDGESVCGSDLVMLSVKDNQITHTNNSCYNRPTHGEFERRAYESTSEAEGDVLAIKKIPFKAYLQEGCYAQTSCKNDQ